MALSSKVRLSACATVSASTGMGRMNQLSPADRLAVAVYHLVRRGVIDTRSVAADALLDYARIGNGSGDPKDMHEWFERIRKRGQNGFTGD